MRGPLVGAFLFVALGAADLAAQEVSGTVFEEDSGRPLPVAGVRLLDTSFRILDATLSDDEGFFTLVADSAGAYFLEGQYLNGEPYRQGPIHLDEDSHLVVAFTLPRSAIELEPVTVEVKQQALALARTGFYERERFGSGIHLSPVELRERQATRVEDLLRTVPGVLVPNARQPGQGYVLFRNAQSSHISMSDGVCAPRILIDGAVLQTGGMMQIAEVLDLDAVVSPEDLLGIEIYRRPAEVPAEYGGAQSLCGVIAVWTVQGG